MYKKHKDEEVGNVQRLSKIVKAFMVAILSKKDLRVQELEKNNLITHSVWTGPGTVTGLGELCWSFSSFEE